MASFIDVAAAAATPVHPLTDDNYVTFTDAGQQFGLYGNDQFGVCGPTATANSVRLSSFLAGSYDEPTQDDVYDLYRRSGNPRFDPSTGADDNGVDNQTMLEAVLAGGIGGRKCLAFATVDHTDLDELRAAVNKFDFVLTGVNLQTAQQTQTVWDYVKSGPWGGHDVLTGKYTSNPANDTQCVSWASFIGMSDPFLIQQMDEAWVIIWPHSYERLSDQEKADLASEYLALTGKDFPGEPIPEPVPTPVPPVPAPMDVDTQLADAAKVWLKHRWHTHAQTEGLRGALTDWLDVHYPSNGNGGRHSA